MLLGVGYAMKNVFKAVLFAVVLVLSATFVFAGPNAPAVNPISEQTISEGSALKLALVASAADSGAATSFSVCPAASTGLCTAAYSTTSVAVGPTTANISTLSATSGEFNWTPSFTQGTAAYYFNLSISDGDSTNSTLLKVTVNDVPPKFGATVILALGNEGYPKTNPLHDTETSRGQNATGTITLSNDGPAPETISSITAKLVPQAGFSENDLKVNYTLPKTTLAPGESMAIPVVIRVPEKLDAVTSKLLKPEPVSVGTLEFSGVSTASSTTIKASTALTLQTVNELDIVSDVKFVYGGKIKSASNDELVKDIRAGQTMDVEIAVKNTFLERENVDIHDVLVKMRSDLLDIDEEEDIGDISPQDKETIKFTITIDEDASDNTYDVEITAEGKDEFGAKHGERVVIRFEIKRKSHEIEIKSLLLIPQIVSCEKEARLTASIRNSGKNNERSVIVMAASPELGFGAVSDTIELDRNDEDTVSFTIPVPESARRPATYSFIVDTYYDSGVKSNTDVALLKVERCGPEPPVVEPPVVPPKDENGPVVIVPPPQQPPANVTPPQQPVVQKRFIDTPQYVALLVLGYIVVVGGGIALLVKLLRKP
ncbi:hypothetical protein HYU18_00210 [Candidatus Woesearchaeota archaeon]|nr:hypothetical protein [Candidatus Woesearchaeota archaeon]